jgi:hypothetical protein
MEERSDIEKAIFRNVIFVMQAVRLIMLIYFIVQTTQFVKSKNRNEIDSNTI